MVKYGTRKKDADRKASKHLVDFKKLVEADKELLERHIEGCENKR